MKMKRWIASLVCIALVCALISACGSANKSDTASERENGGSTNMYTSDTAPGETGEVLEGDQTVTVPIPDDGRKRIRRITMDVQTKEFESLLSSLVQTVSEMEGYLETSEIQNNGYYGGGNRYAYMVARIPKDQVDAFISVVGAAAVIANKQETVEDVTLAYTDTESRIKALEVEQERLMALLEQADSLDAIIALESRLTEVRYELDTYMSQLRTYDNQVEYSYVTMNIAEVERLVEVEARPSVWTRMKNGLSNTMHSIARGAENFAVWFVVNLPYLLIWAAAIVLCVLLLRRIVRTRRIRTDQKVGPPADPEKKPRE